MIKRIQVSEYLKRYGSMEVGERQAYENRVGEWLCDSAPVLMSKAGAFEARLQNAVMLSVGWNDAECRMFEDGVVLLSALVGSGETWLPDMIYAKAAGRCIKRMVGCFEEVVRESGTESRADARESGGRQTAGAGGATQTVGGRNPFRNQSGGSHDREDVRGMEETHRQAALAGATAGAGLPVRPKHIDQYVHLLPQKTQDRAAKYGPLMRELDEMREKERLLMDADGVSAGDREAVAKRIVAIDKEIGAIKKELDSEWARLVESGRVVVDDLGVARVVPCGDAQGTTADGDAQGTTADGDTQGTTADGDTQGTAAERPVELTAEQKARRRELRKWLTDTRRGNGDTREGHLVKWRESFKEYLTLEPKDKALADQKILDAAKHYGIQLPEQQDHGVLLPEQQEQGIGLSETVNS